MNKGNKLYEGKAKIIYETKDKNLVIQHFKDDATAFNNLKKAKVEGKGVLNNRISEYILTNLSQCGIKTHFVKRLNMREQLIKKAEIFPIEFIVRNIATGSLTKRLGIPEGTVLEKPLLEYCYKKDELNDPLISREHIFSFGWATESEIKIIDKITLRINDILLGMFRGIGIKLVDFKIEYGKTWNKETNKKEIVLADEISPDTCRLWDSKTEKKLDKDRFRKDLGNIIQAYQDVARRLGIMPEETNISEVNFGKTIPIKFKKNKLKFSVTVTLKKDVLDPQGKVVQNTLIDLGMNNLKSIRQGKFFEIEIDEKDEKKAEQKVEEMCNKLLVNLIIEDYRISKNIMKSSVIVFPGSNCDRDIAVALEKMQFQNQMVWHKETKLPKSDLIVIPGGFSYGDYLRSGAIAGKSSIIDEVIKAANSGCLVLGICNGFQILTETGLLKGTLLRNKNLKFINRDVNIKVINNKTKFTSKYISNQILKINIAHNEGNYFTDLSHLEELQKENLIAFKYCDEQGNINEDSNPNGAIENIAGIFNSKKIF